MKAKCAGCGLYWSTSIYAKTDPYICPHCESRRRAGEPLKAAKPPILKGAEHHEKTEADPQRHDHPIRRA